MQTPFLLFRVKNRSFWSLDRVDDLLQGCLVVDARVGAAGERGVEIDDVNSRRARGRKARRDLPGGAVVDLGAPRRPCSRRTAAPPE